MRTILIPVIAVALLLTGCQKGGEDSPARAVAPIVPPTVDPPTNPPVLVSDLYFPEAPLAMAAATTTSLHLQFRVALDGPAGQPATEVRWTVIRADGAQVSTGTISTLDPGTSVAQEAMISPAADGEEFTIRLDTTDRVTETSESNNATTTTANLGEVAKVSETFDIYFTDAHYHGMHYNNDPRFHFYLINPNREGRDAAGVTFEIRDEVDGELYYVLPPERALTVKAPTPAQLLANSFPLAEVVLATADLLRRPVPGRHVFRITASVPGDSNVVNNVRRLVVDVPTWQDVPRTAGPIADLQFSDPHVHQYATSVVWHFYIRNLHTAIGSQRLTWRLTREDGVLIATRTVWVSSQQMYETSFRDRSNPGGEARYTLTLIPEPGSQDLSPVGNTISFIVDWTPATGG